MGKSNLKCPAAGAAVIAAVAGPTGAFAAVVPVALTTEIMIEDAGADNLILGSIAHPKTGSTLNYTSSVSSNGSYSYSTDVGQTINGKPVSLSGGGTEKTHGKYYIWKTTDLIDDDGVVYPSTDREVAYYDPTTMHWYIHSVFYWDHKDLEIYIVTNKDITVDADYGYFTRGGKMIPNTGFYSTSYYDDATDDWDIDIWPEYPHPPRPKYEPIPVVLTGHQPGAGPGVFTAMFIPEPSTWAMMILGFGGLGLTGFRHARWLAAAA
jgi:hypothetical protein